MGLGTGATAAIIGGIGAAGSIGGAAIGSNAAGKAGQTQANAADYAANLQKQEADQALGFQEQQYNTEQQQIAPWLQAGTGAINQLAGQNLPSFQAPTADQASQTPGYQFQLQQGMQALQQSAAARGGLLSGGTAKAIDNYSQGLAASNYQQTYNNALTNYNMNVIGPYNRLSALAGVGQQAQASGAQQGQAAANNVTGIDLTTGQQQGTAAENAAAARASGYVGQANAISGGLGGATNSLLQGYFLNNLGGYGSQSGGQSGLPQVPLEINDMSGGG